MPTRTRTDTAGVDSEDPLALILAPPKNEKPVEREARLHAEREAKRISDQIDDELSRQKTAERRKPVKILLLGQSESGKSTTLKNFQLMNSRKAFHSERAAWRTVIQLNVVRSVQVILNAIADGHALHLAASRPSPRPGSSSSSTSLNPSTTPLASSSAGGYFDHAPHHHRPAVRATSGSSDSHAARHPARSYMTVRTPSPPPAPHPLLQGLGGVPETPPPSAAKLTPEHLKLRMRLSPLAQVEDALVRRLVVLPAEHHLLGASSTTTTAPHPSSPSSNPTPGHNTLSPTTANGSTGKTSRPSTAPSSSSSSRSRPSSSRSNHPSGSSARPGSAAGRLSALPLAFSPSASREVWVNSAHTWRGAFGRFVGLASSSSSGSSGSVGSQGGGGDAEEEENWDDPKSPGVVLHACAEDMRVLWTDPVVRAVLAEQKVRLEEMSGFFLDQLERVTARGYVPTDDDVLRARLKTLGVSEYRFTMRAQHAMNHDWRIYDVGGHRSLRAAWVPFFDDMSGIIFLAPVSCFDQVLEEDETVNRIEDSVLLWKAVVANPLLAKTNLVLFLNKCDILKHKLASGIRFAQYVLSYGDRPNDFESVSKYLKRKFAGLQRDYSPESRPFYCHLTSVTDTKTTFAILESVQDMVVRSNLKASCLVD